MSFNPDVFFASILMDMFEHIERFGQMSDFMTRLAPNEARTDLPASCFYLTVVARKKKSLINSAGNFVTPSRHDRDFNPSCSDVQTAELILYTVETMQESCAKFSTGLHCLTAQCS